MLCFAQLADVTTVVFGDFKMDVIKILNLIEYIRV